MNGTTSQWLESLNNNNREQNKCLYATHIYSITGCEYLSYIMLYLPSKENEGLPAEKPFSKRSEGKFPFPS